MKKCIYSKAVIQSLVLSLMMGSATLAFANPTNTATEVVESQTATASAAAELDGVAANEYSTSTGAYDSYNADNSVDTDNSNEWTDSANTNTDNSNEWTDSANTTTDDSINTADSYNAVDSYNSNTDDNSFNLTLGNIGIAVSSSSLGGTVTGASFTVTEGSTLYTGANTVDNGAFNNAAGITQANMNTGFHSLTQQSVNVQSNLNVGQ